MNRALAASNGAIPEECNRTALKDARNSHYDHQRAENEQHPPANSPRAGHMGHREDTPVENQNGKLDENDANPIGNSGGVEQFEVPLDL